MKFYSFVLVVSVFGGVFTNHVSYEGYKVYKLLNPDNKFVTTLNKDLSVNHQEHNFDFWSSDEVMVSPESQDFFLKYVESKNIPCHTLIDDAEKVFEAEKKVLSKCKKISKGSISFDQYHRMEVIHDYLKQISESYPSLTELVELTKSGEGRSVYMLKIGKNIGNSSAVIFVEGGIHAREWIGPPVVLYIIQELLENVENSNMIDTVEWHIVPLLNVDGYEYSHTTDRAWRKNRRPGTNCDGVDPNRNFNFFWEQGVKDECSSTYRGPGPFSEPEISAVADHVTANSDKIKLYLSFHSHCSCILYSWGHTGDPAENVEELKSLGESAANAIFTKFGTEYRVGSSYEILYQLFGGAKDWAKGSLGIDLTYTIELPGGGESGFDLPPDQIENVVTEMWEGVKVWYEYVKQKY